MLVNSDYFYRDVLVVLRKSMDKHLDESLRQQGYARKILADRFFDCLEVKVLPSKYVLLDFTTEKGFTDIEGAAQSCEIYGGIFYRHIREGGNSLCTGDFENSLGMMYGQIGTRAPMFTMLAPFTSSILRSFRRTADYLFSQGNVPQIFTVK